MLTGSAHLLERVYLGGTVTSESTAWPSNHILNGLLNCGTCSLYKYKIRSAKQLSEIVSDSALKQECPNSPLSSFGINFIIDDSAITPLTCFLTALISTPDVSVGTFCVLCTKTKCGKKLDPESD